MTAQQALLAPPHATQGGGPSPNACANEESVIRHLAVSSSGGGAVVWSIIFLSVNAFFGACPPAKAKFLGLMTTGLASAFVLTAPSHAVTLQSGFAGDYTPANWTTTVSGDGSVDTTDAPGSITLTGGTRSINGGYTTYTANATAAGQVSFSWDYSRAFSGSSSFSYVINSNYTLINTGSGSSATGITSFNVAIGDIFGFDVGNGGSVPFGLATVTISNFSAPIPSSAPSTESVPGPLPILGVAAAFGCSRKLRRRINLAKSPVSTDSVAVEQL